MIAKTERMPETIPVRPQNAVGAAPTLHGDAAVGQVAFLFTDLYGSTALDERVGDAAGYNIVQRHFDVLGAIVRDNNGAVVKTIGGAVMATFANPADAVKGALDMQARIADFNQARAREKADHHLAVKLGVHSGQSVKAKLNNRLDYFGSGVNLAARLQDQRGGGDIVLSRVVAEHPAVRPLLAEVRTREENVALKGFDIPVGLVRVLPAGKDPIEDGRSAPTRTRSSVRTGHACLARGGQ